ncbi:MAG: SufD family Fe-S cluster assembly protein [bacterium]
MNNAKNTHTIITVPKNTHLDILDDLCNNTCTLKLDTTNLEIPENHNYSREFILKENSTLNYVLKNIKHSSKKTGPKTCKSLSIIVHLAGTSANATITGLYYGTKTNNFIFKTTQHHQAPHTKSTVKVKSVLNDTAQFTCDNLIRIEKEAYKSEATQSSKNILLSKHAHIIGKPTLEVLAHDAQCKHGAAISTLDTNHLFYLQSRGIIPHNAEQIIIDGFLR